MYSSKVCLKIYQIYHAPNFISVRGSTFFVKFMFFQFLSIKGINTYLHYNKDF